METFHISDKPFGYAKWLYKIYVRIYNGLVCNEAGWRGKAEHINSTRFLRASIWSEYAAHHYSLFCGLYMKMHKLHLWMNVNIRISDTKHNFYREHLCPV
jgi:hypothetical protein